MCGIAGLVGRPPSQEDRTGLAARMAHLLRHRGPDGAGYYLDDDILLVHTRLSIIDLAGGAQPIHNEDKSIWVVFNGEIFNFPELRESLVLRGHRFYTHTDTEVLVHLYEEYGLEFVSHLNGQFAFALWDTQLQRTVLVRDRVGIAPLYYQLRDGVLTFGSEIKAVLAADKESPSFDLAALDQIFTFWTTLPEDTPFRNIKALAPGFMAVFERGQFQLRQYWDHRFPLDSSDFIRDEAESRARIRELLLDAVRIRLRSDVPVGAYLSGGLDSSILTALIHQFKDTRLSTFSISFAEEDHDEKPHQQAMVEFLGTEHRNVHCENSAIGNEFLQAVWHMEYPVVRTAPVPMGILSRLAHESGFKVVLTGEGADELFGGYDLFKETKIRYFWGANPASVFRPKLLGRLYPYLDLQQQSGNSFVRRFFGIGVENRNQPLFSHLTRIASTTRIKTFLHENAKVSPDQAVERLLQALPPDFERWHWLNKAQYLEIKMLMATNLLTSQGDRMLMRNSVEGRFPFLDHRLMEYANQLHPRLKMRVLQEKYILRRALGQYLPEAIAQRVKQPYRAPNIPAFFNSEKPDYVDDLLSAEMLRDAGLFDAKKVELLQKKVRAGRSVSYADNMAVVAILSAQALHRMFIREFHVRFGGQPEPSSLKLTRMQ